MQETLPEIHFPQLKCPENRTVRMVCTNKNCNKFPFLCVQENCKTCEDNHSQCPSYWVGALKRRINSKRLIIPASVRESMNTLRNIYDAAIQKLALHRQLLQAEEKYYGLSQKQAYFAKLLSQNHQDKITSSLISQVMENITQDQKYQVSEEVIRRVWQRKQKQFNKIFDYFTSIQNRTFKRINSEICKDNHIIQSFFDRPILSCQLLFRASQHNYSAAKFHQLCDGKKNTLIIARTQFNKIVGAFTPLEWSSNSSYGYQYPNNNNGLKTFLFSVTQEAKFALKNAQYATYNNPGYGPTFGGGHDFYISNDSKNSTAGYCNFGHSYETNGKQASSQQAYRYFSGAQSGYNTRYEEWQVFQLEI